MADHPNGVDLAQVQQYVEGVKADPAMAQVRFVANSRWDGGTRADITVSDLYVGGQSAVPNRHFTVRTDEPGALGGTDQAQNPAELLAVALCGCLTAGIATNAALFGTELEGCEVSVAIDWNMLGILGLDRSVPTQASGIHYTVKLKGKDKEALRRSKETLDRKSAVLNTLKNAIPVTTDLIIE